MNATPGNAAEPGLPSEDVARALEEAHAAWLRGDRVATLERLSALAMRLPQDAMVRGRLGAYALEAGRYDDALRWLDEALALVPGDAATWTNLGTARLRLGRAADAIVAYRRALALDPGARSAHVNLGSALQQTGDVDAAVEALETARALDPESPEVLNNLGNLYKEQGRADAAFAAYEDARRAAPAFAPAFSNLLAATKLSTRQSPAEIYALHRGFSAQFEADWRAGYLPPANTPDPGRRLRLGYVSPDCHTALPAFVEPTLRAHDRTRFDVCVYFNNPQPRTTLDRLGPVTARVMRGESDGVVAQWIRDDRIDVLIDIAGHTGHNRLGVFGRKPAPVQITWLDYLNTTGLDAIDYRITDAVSDPPGNSEAVASEALLRIAPAQWCWNPPLEPDEPGPLPLLAAGHPTLGSFNTGAKLTDETLALWARVLAETPTARLVVVGVAEGSAQARVRAAFGQAESRVQVLARLAPDAFRRTAATVDLALDPRPFSGATTTLEMLVQGVPVVTWPGATSPSRSTASLLSALGLEAFIARNADDYVAIVQRTLGDPPALAALRAALPKRLRASALCDATAFARKLEALVVDAWQTWCARKSAPASIIASPPSAVAALRTIDDDARLARIEAALRARDIDGAVALACALVDDRPEWQAGHRAYLRALLAWSHAQPDLVPRMFPPPPALSGRPRVSVVICSIDRGKFARVTASYRERFAGHPLEIVGVHDARSLAEGYNRAAARAAGDILIFSHDDIELETPDFAGRLLAHLDRFDGIGIAGASKVVGPQWGQAGQRHVHGHVLHASPANRRGVLLMASGFQAPVCEGIRVLDGVFLAVRRHVWETLRFDADTYDGFHLYDLDFTWRASAAGARLAVPLDLLLLHHSTGRYDAAWRRYARRFVARAGLDPLAPPVPGGLQARLDTTAQVEALRAAMLHFRFGAPVRG